MKRLPFLILPPIIALCAVWVHYRWYADTLARITGDFVSMCVAPALLAFFLFGVTYPVARRCTHGKGTSGFWGLLLLGLTVGAAFVPLAILLLGTLCGVG
jgi:hypothetical protein